MAEILLKDAVKTFNNGKLTAVNHFSLECHDHEFIAILGPSGAGKTTTLNLIAGIERLENGQICIGGKDVTDLPPQSRNVSMVFEGYALYPHLTVRENLAFPLKAPVRAEKLTKEQVNNKVEEWAKTIGMLELLDRKPSQLSGGQRQRVSLARALVRSPAPNVILMDEPIAHLDAKLRNSMRAELKRLQKDLGAPIIYVTHDYTEAMAMADRIYVINNGCLQQEGVPREIYNNPVDEFVASTVGEPPMNFIPGRLEHSADGSIFCFREEKLKLPRIESETVQVDLGIRPSEITVTHEKLAESCLKGEIQEILPTGAKQIMEINIQGKMILVKVDRDLSYAKGNFVFLTPAIEKTCLFDSDSKKRLNWIDGGK